MSIICPFMQKVLIIRQNDPRYVTAGKAHYRKGMKILSFGCALFLILSKGGIAL